MTEAHSPKRSLGLRDEAFPPEMLCVQSRWSLGVKTDVWWVLGDRWWRGGDVGWQVVFHDGMYRTIRR